MNTFVGVLAFLGLLAGVKCQTYPGDVAGHVGDVVNVTCRGSSIYGNALWKHQPYGESESPYVYFPQQPIVSGYSIDEDNPFDLVIHSLSEASSGRYGCSLTSEGIPETERSAYVMVIDDMMCDEESSGDQANREIRFVCSVRVYGEVTPNLQWTREGSALNSEELVVSDDDLADPFQWRTVSLTYTTTAQAEFDNSEHTCRVYFDTSSASTVAAATFESTCTDVYRVTHAPTNVRITHDGLHVIPPTPIVVNLGDSINCTVSSYPPAVMTWQRMEGSGTTTPNYDSYEDNESQLWVDETMMGGANMYECVATQGVNKAKAQVYFTVVDEDGLTGKSTGLAYNLIPLAVTIIFSFCSILF